MRELETHELVVQALPAGPNALRGQHWSTLRGNRHMVGYAVLEGWCKAGRPRAHGRRARVHIHIRAPGPPDDLDNRLARMKVLLDQLVVCGALTDDSERFLQIDVPSRERASRSSCLVTIAYEGAGP